jgi:hypothetical protein
MVIAALFLFHLSIRAELPLFLSTLSFDHFHYLALRKVKL